MFEGGREGKSAPNVRSQVHVGVLVDLATFLGRRVLSGGGGKRETLEVTEAHVRVSVLTGFAAFWRSPPPHKVQVYIFTKIKSKDDSELNCVTVPWLVIVLVDGVAYY